jgi:integrase/recombinase XerD
MSPLRKRMIDDLVLAGYSERTQQAYVRAVWQLAVRYQKSPASITEDELRDYFVYLREEKHFARSSMTIALCGIKFLFEKTLRREWHFFELCRPPRENRLPVVLTVEEVAAVLKLVRITVYRLCLTTIYSCGLRLMEGARVGIADIDVARRQLYVQGKGNKGRYVPIPGPLVDSLLAHWQTHRSPQWVFPAPTRHGTAHSVQHDGGPLNRGSLQSAFYRAVNQAGIRKKAHVHTLRHSYATHLLESGVNLRLIQTYLGHNSPKTTAIYTHLTRELHEAAREHIEALLSTL